MLPNSYFISRGPVFWAYVRAVSQELGYAAPGEMPVKVHSAPEIASALCGRGLDGSVVYETTRGSTPFGEDLVAYFTYRADVLNRVVRNQLMDADEAAEVFRQTREMLNPACPLPMNKQTGEKKAPAYLTGLVNMLVEANSAGHPCDYDPRELTRFTRDGRILRTFARRVDGAFPSVVNPVAIWEIKEYYYTTTFGSRVADGVYETLLDGMELRESSASEGVATKHCLMVDGRYTWWNCGKSYLCRLVDMLNMGLVDEILVGREVVERLPQLVREWVTMVRGRGGQ